MARGQTKELLLETGRRLFLEKGYNHSGLESILQDAGVPKGSFYNYFQSKEDFGLQVIDRFAEVHEREMERSLGDLDRSPLDRIRSYFESVITHLETGRCRNGCLVGKLSQEMADQSEKFRLRLDEIFDRWTERFAQTLAEARDAGQLKGEQDVRPLAEFWLNSWQGAILRAKTARSTEPLRLFVTMTIDREAAESPADAAAL